MYDVIIVGARVAGSPTAMLLARKGYRVLLVDRATFPSDTLSTHAVHASGIAQLARWGLLDRLAATDCPPIDRYTFDLGPFALTGSPPPAGDVAAAYAPRRFVLDTLLVEAAVEAGAELREGFAVHEILTRGDRVTGIRGAALGGAVVTEQARIVVGADGMHSRVARAVRAAEYNVRPPLAAHYYSYWSGVPADAARVYPRDGRTLVELPTHGGLTCIGVDLPHRDFHAFRTDVEGNFLEALEQEPALAARVRAGRREERFMGTAGLVSFFRKPYGPGWALVGDAGYHKDATLGQGITDAFRDADLLAEAIDDGFSGRRPLEAALADYEHRRNRAATPMYELVSQLATLEPPPPEMQQLFAALKGNQAETDRFMGVIAGTVPVQEFFAPANVARVIAAAHLDRAA
jgi:flavin-dependent dehydrogenase